MRPMEGGQSPAALLSAGIDALLHGRLDEAIRLAGETIEAATTQMVADSRGVSSARESLALRARAESLHGRARLERFDYRGARSALLASKQDWRHHPDQDPLGAAATEAALASLHWLCDDPDSAVSAARVALAELPAHPSLTQRQDAAHVVCHLAFVDIPGRTASDIREQLLSAVDALEAVPSAHPLELANVRFVLAMIEQRLGHHREAADLFESVQATRARVLGADHPYVAYAMHGEAQTALDLGDHQACGRLAEAALETLVGRLGPDHPNVTTFLLTRGMAHLLGDRPDRFMLAREDFENGLRVSRAHFGKDSPQNATAWLMLGVAHYAAAEAQPAEDALRTALQLGLTHPRTRGDVAVTALRHLSEIWRLQERFGEILQAIEYAVEVWTRHPSLSAETAVRWALQGSEAALAADRAGAAGALLDTAWRLCGDPEAVNDALRGAVERTRAAFVELAEAADESDENDEGEDDEG
jgi:hypothetical protein